MTALLALLPQIIAIITVILKGTQSHDAPVETQKQSLDEFQQALEHMFQTKDTSHIESILARDLAPIVRAVSNQEENGPKS